MRNAWKNGLVGVFSKNAAVPLFRSLISKEERLVVPYYDGGFQNIFKHWLITVESWNIYQMMLYWELPDYTYFLESIRDYQIKNFVANVA